MKKLSLFLCVCFLSAGMLAQNTANYTIVFTSNWDAHGALPGNAHFTELVGATHNNNAVFLEMGGLATPGIELVAELGLFGTFENEVTAVINAGNADQFIQGPNLYPTSTAQTITISDLEVDINYPLVSLASMIAPSPDWMLAINSVSLIDNSNQWIPEIILDVYPYDAGTEEGTGYSLNNPATNPHEAISSLQGVPPFNSQPIGTFVFTQDVLSTPSIVSETRKSTIFPNPSSGNITIKTGKSIQLQKIVIFSILGEKVYNTSVEQNIGEINLSLANLNTGVYLIQMVETSGNITTNKLILR